MYIPTYLVPMYTQKRNFSSLRTLICSCEANHQTAKFDFSPSSLAVAYVDASTTAFSLDIICIGHMQVTNIILYTLYVTTSGPRLISLCVWVRYDI